MELTHHALTGKSFICRLPFIVFLVVSLSGFAQKTKINCTAPTVTMSADVTICQGASVTVSATGSGTSSPYTYDWAPVASVTCPTCSNTSVNPTVTTTYTCLVTDGVTCTNTGTVTVTVNSTPTATISGSSTLCSGSSATLNGSGGGTYQWQPGGSTATSIVVNPTANTTYTLIVTNANACTDADLLTVTVSPSPTVAIGGAGSICATSTATLTASGANDYVWSPGGSTTTSIQVTPTVGTTYTLVGTNSVTGCANTATATVSLNPLPTATITGNTTICIGQSTTLNASGGTNYSWSTGALTSSIAVNPTNTTFYTVQATDGNGCTDLATQAVIVVPAPLANAGSDVSICPGSSTTLSGSGNGTSYVWSPSTALSNTTIVNPVANPTASITYTLTSTNFCGTANDQVTVTINPSPSVNAGTDKTICPGGQTTLTTSGSGSYAWLPGTSLSCSNCPNPVANPTVSTHFTVTITDICGSASDDVWVIVSQPSVNISGTGTICSGSSSTLSASGNGSYVWSTGASTSSIVVSPTTGTNYTVTVTDVSGCTDSDVFTVTVNPKPNAGINGNTTVCSGVNDTLVAIGGNTYVWNTGLTNDTLIVSPTSASNYTVTVYDVIGCSNTASINISILPQPTASAGADLTVCSGNSATLNGSGNGSYLWSPAASLSNPNISNPVATPTVTSGYTLTVTNICGTAIDLLVITVPAAPTITVTAQDTICLGGNVTLTAAGSTGTYLWNTGGTTSSIVVTPTSSSGYSVALTDVNGCTASDSHTVTVSSVNASVSAATTICAGGSSTLAATGGSGYLWNTGATTSQIVVAPTAGTGYSVTVSNAFGCTAVLTSSVSVISQPTATVTTSSPAICSGGAATLTASGGTSYLWIPASGLSNPNAAITTASPSVSTTYSVIVSIGSCTDTASALVNVNTAPTASISTTSTGICQGGCATLTASGGQTYNWMPGNLSGSTINPCPTTVTAYTVTVTDANGCTDNASAIVNVLPPINLVMSGDTTLCANGSTILTAQGGSSYIWNTGATSSSISVSPSVSTSYTVVSTNGACSDTAVINVTTYPLPTALATAISHTINIGGQTTLNASTSTGTYNWSPTTGLSCGACQSPTASPTVTTIYTLLTLDGNGCLASDTVIVIVGGECGEVFLPTAFSPNYDGFNDEFRIRNLCLNEIEFNIYNRWGQKVFSTDDPTIGWDGLINGKEADPAVFFYVLTYDLITNPGKFYTKQGQVSLVR